ncbi:hypothetical protein [Nocardia carnea]|uniref:hypothetical protein n=1 Tax=Nocardia carnea TaxID=37328 RepID=UPI0024542090|nr:hypothetical protein [Nocardia carnea]
MMVRVGAVHLGWDVVSVAAGGSGVPIRPVQVEGSYNPPAYLLADASGKLYTAGADRQRPDLGMAIPDVREILGHPQIVIAGATWPAELVFRARLYNPLAAVGTYLRGKPDVIALPYPDDWPEPKIDAYARLVEQLDVEVEPIPESIALSGYVRALGLVRAPDHTLPGGIGATAVHFDGQVVDGRANVLVVAVHGDEERPTESVYVPIDPESTRNPRIADDTVIEVMAAARAIGADNSTVLLAGQVVFNETLRFAFRNHLGQRLKKAEHPMHALVLGATHLLVTENEDDEEEDPAPYPQPAPGSYGSGAHYAVPGRPGEAGGPPMRNPAAGPHPPAGSPASHPPAGPNQPGPYAAHPGSDPASSGPAWPGSVPVGSGPARPGPDLSSSGHFRPGETGPSAPGMHAPGFDPRESGPTPGGGSAGGPQPGTQQFYGARPPVDAPHPGAGDDATVQVDRSELPPPISGAAGRFTRAPDPETGNQPAAAPVRPGPGQPPDLPGSESRTGGGPGSGRAPEGEPSQGKLWNKVKDNLFGAHAVLGVASLLALSGWATEGVGTAQALPRPVGVTAVTPAAAGAAVPHDAVGAVVSSDGADPVSVPRGVSGCVPMPRLLVEPPAEAGPAAGRQGLPLYARAPEAGEPESSEHDGSECGEPGIDTLRYLVPGRPGITDPGPPFDI